MNSTENTNFPTIESFVGNTPLVRLQRLPGKTSNTILVKLEGNNPAGSVKDRPALSMIQQRLVIPLLKQPVVIPVLLLPWLRQ